MTAVITRQRGSWTDSDGDLMRAHADAVQPTMMRRRSLHATLSAAMLASWAVVEDRIDDHLEFRMRLLNAEFDFGPTGRPDRALWVSLHDGVEGWLVEVAALQDITWRAPVTQTARTLLAAFGGLITDYAARRDSAGAREIVALLAFHLSQSGLRRTKVPAR